MASPTFIFQSPRHLKYFLDHFSTFVQNHLPPFMISYSMEDLPRGPTREDFKEQPISVTAFFSELKTLARYNSNIPGDRQRDLMDPTEATAVPKFDHFSVVSRVLTTVQTELQELRNWLNHSRQRTWYTHSNVSASLLAGPPLPSGRIATQESLVVTSTNSDAPRSHWPGSNQRPRKDSNTHTNPWKKRALDEAGGSGNSPCSPTLMRWGKK
jgi:hypothetical protein